MDFPSQNVPVHYVNRDKHLMDWPLPQNLASSCPNQTKRKIGFKGKESGLHCNPDALWLGSRHHKSTEPHQEKLPTNVTKNGHDSWGSVHVISRFLFCQKPFFMVLAVIVSFSNRMPYRKSESPEFKIQLWLLLTVILDMLLKKLSENQFSHL